MEIPWDKFLLFLAFFVPGFIARQIYGLYVGIDQTEAHKILPTIIGFSAIHYGLTAFPLLLLPTQMHIWYEYFDVLILPVIWTPIVLLVRDFTTWKQVFCGFHGLKLRRRWCFIQIVHGYSDTGFVIRPLNFRGAIAAIVSSEKAPWELVLTDQPRFIRIRLKSGRFVGGYYGRNSYASTAPTERQLYISNMYRFAEDGQFLNEVLDTGLLVQGDEIETLENIGLMERT